MNANHEIQVLLDIAVGLIDRVALGAPKSSGADLGKASENIQEVRRRIRKVADSPPSLADLAETQLLVAEALETLVLLQAIAIGRGFLETEFRQVVIQAAARRLAHIARGTN